MPTGHHLPRYRLTKLNEYLVLFPGSDEFKNMSEPGLNVIILYSMPNGWSNQSYFLELGFQVPYNKASNIFERMKIT